MGVRCWGDRYTYVVVSGTAENPVLVASKHVRLPVNGTRPKQLSEFRQDVYDILTQHHVTSVCFRSQETISPKKSIVRAELEGVLQETCFSHKPSVSIIGRTVKQLKSVLHFAGQADKVVQLSNRPEFSSLAKTNCADAIVAALSALSG